MKWLIVLAVFGIFVSNLARVGGSISLGSCSLSCSENEGSTHKMIGRERMIGPPGKIGPRGPKGFRGPVGPRGATGTCQCDKYEKLAEELNVLKLSIEDMRQRIYFKDCKEAKKTVKTSGVHVIYPFVPSSGGIHVYCNQDIDGGGWIVIQRRVGNYVDFYRGWQDYVRGFGSKEGDFWLGLETIHRLTHENPHELRVDLMDSAGNKKFAKYKIFSIKGEDDNYRLNISRYSGNSGDALTSHNDMQFTTKDRDNDIYGPNNCASLYKGGWWYNNCHTVNLNGMYGGSTSSATGVSWYSWKTNHESLKYAEMKIRRGQ